MPCLGRVLVSLQVHFLVLKLRQSRSTKILALKRPRPSMLMATPWTRRTSLKSSPLNRLPWRCKAWRSANSGQTCVRVYLRPETPGGTSGQMQWNSSGVFAGFGSYNSSTLLATFPGGVATTTSGGYGGFISSPEGTVGNGTLGANAAAATDVCYADTTTHAYLCSFNNSAFLPLVTSPVALSELATEAANTIDMNASGSSAAPTAVVMPACAASGHADVYDPSAHTWTCNSIGGGAGVVLVPQQPQPTPSRRQRIASSD